MPRVIRTTRPWWNRLWRELHAAYLEWCVQDIERERARLLAEKFPIGPKFLADGYAEQEALRVRIADLRNT